MKKRLALVVFAGLASLFLVLLLPSAALAAPAEVWVTSQITSNSLSDTQPLVSGDRIVWTANVGGDSEVFTWSPSGGVTQITNNAYDDNEPRVSGDRVVWWRSSATDTEIYMWTPGGGTVQLTNNSYTDTWCDVSGDRVVWGAANAEACLNVFMWTPSGGTVQITTNVFCESIHVSGDRIVWYVSSEAGVNPAPGVYTWTPAGGIQQVSSGYTAHFPVVSGDRIAWMDFGDSGSAIYTWTPAGGAVKIASQASYDGQTSLSGDRIAWSMSDGTDPEVFTCVAGENPVQLSTTTGETWPQVSGDRVIWSGKSGTTWKVYCWTAGDGTVALASLGISGAYTAISGNRAAWTASDGSDSEIFSAVAYPVTVPAITSIDPASAPTTGGATVVINGSGFLGMSGAAAVKFGGTNATSYTVNSPTKITAVAPAHAAGKVDVTVTAAGGASGTAGAGNDFLYLARYDQADAHFAYTGTWTVSTTTSASGGSFRFCNAGGSVTVSFTGTYLAWIAKTSPVYGKAKVTLDNQDPVTVDLYSATTLYQRPVWSTGTLESGTHTVKIEWTGTKNSSATDTNVSVDAFDIQGTLTQATALSRYQETAAALAFAGTWSKSTVASASGGTFKYANVSGASVTVPFTGTSLSWIAKKSPSYGKAKVSVDGGSSTTVDLYDAGTLYQRNVWSSGKLTSGLHWVKIEWTGVKNSSATGANIGIDAVDVMGSLTAATRFEQTNAKLVWAGTWTTSTTTSASGSSFKFANKSGASVTVKFTGISCNLIAKKSPLYGIAQIKLDDQPAVLVDFYNASALFKQTVWKSGFLVAGDHTVTIKWTGTKRAAATDYNVDLDAADVIGTLR